MSDKKMLLITTSFPPKGGPGVQRNLKFSKYWPEFGWKPFVLTTKEIYFPVKDYTLLEEVHPETEIVRTETLDPRRLIYIFKSFKKKKKKKSTPKSTISEASIFYRGYKFVRKWFFIPDVGVLWLPFSLIRGLHVIKKNKINVIIGSCPGPSNIMISYLLSKITKIPYVLDFRDGWMDYPYNTFPTKLHEKVNWWLEKKTLPKATLFMTYGEYLTNKLSDRYQIPKNRFVEITNGFDPMDFKDLQKRNNTKNEVRIVHSGNIYETRKPVFENLILAYSRLPKELRDQIYFDFVGSCYSEAEEYVEGLRASDHVVFHGYMSHKEALKHLVNADATLILLPKGDFAAFTGKVFEYIALGKTIIEIGEPSGSCGVLLNELFEENTVAYPDDISQIEKILEIAVKRKGLLLEEDVKQPYSRVYQAELFVNKLNTIV